MLCELHVRDLALVEDVWLELDSGLTVLSGETGAGKTVLVSALKLLLGERADSALVRQGAEEAVVEGRFSIDGAEVLVCRRVSAEGRSRCTIDGEMATVTMLAELLGGHVDLHGQHEHQALLSPSNHAGYLDRFIGQRAVEALERYRNAWRGTNEARGHLAGIEGVLADRDRRAEYLRFLIGDIDAVSPGDGEIEELEARLPRLRHGDRLSGAANSAWASLREDDGASDHLSRAASALGAAAGLDPVLDALSEVVKRIDLELQDAAVSLREYADTVEHDPAALDAVEQRLHQLADLTRKYGPGLEDVIRTREEAAHELELLEDGEAGLVRARAELVACEAELRGAGEALVAARDGAVGPFCDRLAAATADLALPNASFQVDRVLLPFESWTADGPERVEFLFASGSGEVPRPLAKVASGGEVSRVMLALKSVLGVADSVPVLVFDEVDAGIGGATALAVGQRLASLAEGHQVLVVTHLPQVAAYADSHVVVEKSESGERTVTTARLVEGEDLVTEIARMLAGGSSSTGLAHARELLDSAGRMSAAKG
ncbi:MAG: DNA repair protein RecN [Coriobacteriia bacterium]|nr:DNA repair protein RecN [Coriobacteriia bacterium]